MVFYHEIDPSMGNKEHQGKLNSIHSGKSSSINISDHGIEVVESNTLSSAPPLESNLTANKYPYKDNIIARC